MNVDLQFQRQDKKQIDYRYLLRNVDEDVTLSPLKLDMCYHLRQNTCNYYLRQNTCSDSLRGFSSSKPLK